MFIQNTIAMCRKQGGVRSCVIIIITDDTGYVTTLMNRRRYFPSINNDNFMNRSHAERQAVNFVIQGEWVWYLQCYSMCAHTGSAADICKAAMLKVMETLTQFTSQAKYQPCYYLVTPDHSILMYRLLLQIHDELLFEIPTKDLHQLAGRSIITISSVISYNKLL